ncbi:interleukin-17A-like [Simochromis diagramma]|uniref:interleukin-17A-like n=1 Tax=Simochromis diagramma TaxID=43689 RepID=UPI001A7E8557|nr:interleukin-17A-like [Simochromis diagramma]XP_039878785.1 interleukin-17A-like [Simochromis diagramma]
MNSSAILLFLGLMGTAFSSPVCPQNCNYAQHYHRQYFTHVSDLHNSSVAPWKLQNNSKAGREPQTIKEAKCMPCSVENMVARPIFVQIQVYESIGEHGYCSCPFDLAVGCTCVAKE